MPFLFAIKYYQTTHLTKFGGRLLFLLFLLLGACKSEPEQEQEAIPSISQFTLVEAKTSGLQFVNNIPEDQFRNIIRYQYYYNGGGVALGDINNDGWTDICFSANNKAPVLYQNLGDMKFKDISAQANLVLPSGTSWNTGISMLDVNNDGYLDIYLCRSGNLKEENRRNLLYVNNQDGTFTEQGAQYGLDDPGYSIQIANIDYDKDGDLDLFLANHGVNFYGRDPQGVGEKKMDQYSGDKLYRNDEGTFVDVSRQSGILQRAFSYGLGVGIGDLNQDGWDDIYLSNDFFEHDYLYFNQGNGTFKESVKKATKQLSFFSMGNDVSDLNNDGLLDVIVLDMMPSDHIRRQSNLAGLSYEKFWDFVDKGYHYQYMFNCLHANNGNGTFANKAMLAGLSQTDWSWAPLIADLDNDGLKDVYITNGLRKDVLNLDFVNNTTPKYARYASPGKGLPKEHFLALLRY